MSRTDFSISEIIQEVNYFSRKINLKTNLLLFLQILLLILFTRISENPKRLFH